MLFVSCNAFTSDLGVIGTTYPIIERDLIDVIHERIEEKTKSGELDELHQGMKERSKEYASKPPGVGLPRAQVYRAVEVNPVYTLEEDIVDAEGKVLFKAGTKVNPLEIRPLTKTLCFIDGDDSEQVTWLETYCAQDPRNKLILVNGNFQMLSKQTGLRLYFDQRGYLVERFGITAVPAVIRQSGKVLYVEEFPIN
ncbi:type-F conjugative transfer system protein TraW [Vibrio cholerae]|nr:type-F conjugative transfer system protein TraW [Vibrio cholerae]EKO3939139.1 type-F conjugative transfer system protein TraW [Vibrio metschnikovii]QEO42732.1 type-F conjugative transfer system protein TraW [Vibrio cholerae]HAS4037836.1 type-F conjugative transfer system protein TraW [Vibrio cholerae]HDP8606452.1 type-F conjugative transfer system protein TraW [Vibrio cholerae]